MESPALRERIAALAPGEPVLRIDGLTAGYGKMEVLHGIDLRVSAGQSLCIIGPNGSGKSTILNAICGLADVSAGRIEVNGRDLTHLAASARLREAGMTYLLQENSVFPDMTVEENLALGGYLMRDLATARRAAQRVFDRYPRLADRRARPARVLSGGERRLLEISRALMMDPQLLLIDEPSIGLEPRFIEIVFEILRDLRREGKAVVTVEQNARKGLEGADIGCVVVAGEIATVGSATELLADPTVARLFLGG
jgi:branched-chain amino acid transport system ATP-binding protein